MAEQHGFVASRCPPPPRPPPATPSGLVVALTSVTCRAAVTGKFKVDRMRDKRVHPTGICFKLLLNACTSAGHQCPPTTPSCSSFSLNRFAHLQKRLSIVRVLSSC